jgi:hypothetical protein
MPPSPLDRLPTPRSLLATVAPLTEIGAAGVRVPTAADVTLPGQSATVRRWRRGTIRTDRPLGG